MTTASAGCRQIRAPINSNKADFNFTTWMYCNRGKKGRGRKRQTFLCQDSNTGCKQFVSGRFPPRPWQTHARNSVKLEFLQKGRNKSQLDSPFLKKINGLKFNSSWTRENARLQTPFLNGRVLYDMVSRTFPRQPIRGARSYGTAGLRKQHLKTNIKWRGPLKYSSTLRGSGTRATVIAWLKCE